MILFNHSTPAQEPKIRVTAPINNSRFMVGGLFFFLLLFGDWEILYSWYGLTQPQGGDTHPFCVVSERTLGEKISNGFAVANFVNKESTESSKVLRHKVEGESRYFMKHCIKPLEAKVSQLLFDENSCHLFHRWVLLCVSDVLFLCLFLSVGAVKSNLLWKVFNWVMWPKHIWMTVLKRTA